MSVEKKSTEEKLLGNTFLDRRKWEIRGLIAFTYTLGFFSIVYITLFTSFPTQNKEVITVLLGLLGGTQGMIVQYYFGSSRDIAISKSKDNVSD